MAGKKISPEAQARGQLTKMVLAAGLKIGDSRSNNGFLRISETNTPEAGALERFEDNFAAYGIVQRNSTLQDRSFTLDHNHSSFITAIGKLVEERASEELAATHSTQTQAPKLGAIVNRFLGGDDIDFGPGLSN